MPEHICAGALHDFNRARKALNPIREIAEGMACLKAGRRFVGIKGPAEAGRHLHYRNSWSNLNRLIHL
jgi:hypothetical protein